jgi:GNAT superfamily N-acetyltransferase
MSDTIEFRRADVREIIDLRHAVLRKGFPREAAMFAGDDEPTTRHFAAVADGRVIGCATIHLNSYDGQAAWQLRGMAVEQGFRSRGVGSLLLDAVEQSVRQDSPIRLMWANARTPARPFYQRNGWAVVSEEFVVPESGPHFRMVRRL